MSQNQKIRETNCLRMIRKKSRRQTNHSFEVQNLTCVFDFYMIRIRFSAIGNSHGGEGGGQNDCQPDFLIFTRIPATQQHSDQEHREGDSSSSAAVKSKVNADRKDQEVSDGFSIEGNLPGFLLVSWSPPLASGLPWFFVFCLWCCSESEDSVNLLRIQRSNSLCDLVSLLFSCTLSSSQVSMHYTLSITVCTCTPCQ